MKSVGMLLAALALAGFLPRAALAQDKDAEKKQLLEKVEKRLKDWEDQLLRDLERVIDEELKGGKRAEAPRVEPPRPAPAPAPAPAPRKARGYLGVRPADLSPEEKKDLGLKNGIRVVEVVPEGPAAKAGLKPDDVITAIDGRAVDSPQEVPVIIQASGPGAKVKLEIVRDGKKQTLEATLARHPQDPPEAPKDDPKAGDLRERVKKFLQKEEAPKAEAPKPLDPAPKPLPAPGDEGGFALDEGLFEQMRGILEQFGMDPEQYFEKGKDGKYRFSGELREMFKGFNFDRFKDLLPGGGAEPAPKKPEPRKVEPRKEDPKPAPRPEPKGTGKPYLGVTPEELSEELRAQLDLEEGAGLLVTEAAPGSPAEKAGLRKNDILLKIDGKPVKGEPALAAFMQSAKIGQELTLTILRKGKEQTLKATLAERKE